MGLITVIIGIVIFFITLGIDVYTDIRLWKKGQSPNHRRGAILRLIGLIPTCILLGWPTWWVILAAIPVVGFVYMFLFDGLYNKFRGFDWWFTGSDDPDDAKSDDFFQRLKPWQHKLIKFGGIIVSAVILVIAKMKDSKKEISEERSG